MLARTIQQLVRQDYPGNWLIQVIDNNTPNPQVWLPIRDLCQQLRDRVQFMHLDNWPGFKSGALNEGTRRLPSWIEVIAVVDADYLAEPGFLRATARHFADERVAFVQTRQHYREWIVSGDTTVNKCEQGYHNFNMFSAAFQREFRSSSAGSC